TSYMKRPPIKQTNKVERKIEPITAAAKCYVCIKRNPIISILNFGAAVSIITNDLRKRLRLKITQPSKTIVIIADGTHQRALGEIENVGIAIQDLFIPLTITVIESIKENLLLEIDFLYKTSAQIDFQNGTVLLKYKGKETVSGIIYI